MATESASPPDAYYWCEHCQRAFDSPSVCIETGLETPRVEVLK